MAYKLFLEWQKLQLICSKFVSIIIYYCLKFFQYNLEGNFIYNIFNNAEKSHASVWCWLIYFYIYQSQSCNEFLTILQTHFIQISFENKTFLNRDFVWYKVILSRILLITCQRCWTINFKWAKQIFVCIQKDFVVHILTVFKIKFCILFPYIVSWIEDRSGVNKTTVSNL